MINKALITICAMVIYGTLNAANATTIPLSKDFVGECVTVETLDMDGVWGKGTIMPPTCIEDPCDEVSYETFYREIIGHEVAPMIYDAFLRKQDDTCPRPIQRAEFTDEELQTLIFSGSPIPPTEEPQPHPTPLPPAFILLVAALVSLKVWKHRS